MLREWFASLFGAIRRKPENTLGATIDADPTQTRPATWRDAIAVCRLLEKHSVRYALVGGYALAAHGYVRVTQDVDILVARSPENAARWVAALSELPERAAAGMQGESDPFGDEEHGVVRLNDEFTIDIMARVCGFTYEELAERITTIDDNGFRVRVVDIEGLLLTKQGVRPKDVADANLLRAALRELGKG